MDKTRNVTAQYTFFQKMLAVVLLFSVLTTTFLTSNLGLEGLFGKSVKAKVDGVITSFINVPDEITKVDAGIAKEKIVFPKIIGANVEKDGITKKVYFNAVWECDSLSQNTDKTQLDTKYAFTLAESCVPADLKAGLKLPQINVESGKYCIKGFEDLSPELLVITTNTGKEVKFPETVKAYVGLDTEPTDIRVNWKSDSETVQGGASKSFDKINEKHTFKAVIVETDKYYLSKEMTDINLAAYTVPFMTVYVMGTAEAYVSADYETESENGNVGYFKTLTAAYDFINKKGGSGTIIINDSYEYFNGKNKNAGEDYYTIVGNLQDGYSDSYFNEPEHKGMIIIKGNTPNATLKMHYRYYLNGPLMFKDITLQAAVSMKERIYARGNDLVMGTGLTCTWGTDLTDGYVEEYSNALRIYGGTANTDLEGNTNVVVLSGDYYLIRGGNEEGGTINGNTFVYLGGTAHTYYQLMGGSRKGTINGSTYVMVAGDAVADSKSGGPNELPSVAVFGGGLEGTVKADLNGDGICDGGLHVIINGGTVNAAVTGSGADEKYNGKTYVTVCGDALIYPSSEGAVFGAGSGSGDGSSNAEVSGDILVNIFCNAKLAKNDYYAHVYGTNTSKNTNSDITMNVYDNANIEGSINGGAFVANSGIGSSLNDPKNVNVNVYGSAFVRLNVYGGSLRKGIVGDTSVSITENAVVKGNVYGGGQGAASVSEQNGYGSAINSSVYLSGNVSVGDVYGGGNYGSNSGYSEVIIENASVGGSVYGGSQEGGVAGSTAVTVSGSEIAGSVYGGNNNVGIIYPKTTASIAKLNEGTVVKGSVYGGGNEGESTVTNLTLENVTVEGSVFGGSVSAEARLAHTKIKENTTVKGDVFGSGKNGNVGTAKIEISLGFVNNVYGGGETAHADSVDITISGKEDGFTFDVSGKIDGLPKNKGTESEIASYFDSDSSYVLKLNEFDGISGKTFNDCASVESISNFSEVSLKDTKLTFNGTTVEYLEGITLLNLDNSTLELPLRTTLASAFTSGGVYSTAKQNVLPSTLNGNNESKIAMPSREMTDEEEISANGKIDSILKVYGKITGEFELFVDGEKKSGTYITSFHDGSNVGADIEKPT
ncbi:MAG: hypothetical protein J6V36_04690, partial [Clostridia bacterium]|nr:hypothetical protein [Clostridia bacterium]